MNDYSKEEQELSAIARKLSYSPETMFYGLFLAEVPRRVGEIPGIETACLHKHSESSLPEMFFSSKFWNSLDEKEKELIHKKFPQRMFLVRHELEHYCRNHLSMDRDFGWQHNIAGYAMDLSINTFLLREAEQVRQAGIDTVTVMELPEGGLTPSSYPELQMEGCKDSKYYYDILIKAKQEKQESARRGEDSKSGQKGKGTSGSELLDRQIDHDEDLHKGWEEVYQNMSEIEKKILQREIMKKIEQVAQETEKRKGTVPMDIKQALENLANLQPPTVPWQVLFKRFIGSVVSNDLVVNRKRPSRRFEEAFATKYKQKISVGFFSDSSGSVDNESLQRCWVELEHVYKAGGDVWYASWDGECEEPQRFKGLRTTTLDRTKSGGTIIDEAVRKSNETAKKNGYCCSVITSDGYIGGLTEKSKVPLLIIITPTGTIDFQNPHGYKVIRMN